MATLAATIRCSGHRCPSRDICRRYPVPGEAVLAGDVMTALWVRRGAADAACDEYLPRDVEESRHAGQ